MKLKATVLILGMGLATIAGCGGDDPFDPDRPRRDPAMGVGGQLAPVDLPGQGEAKPGKNAKGTGSEAPPPPPTGASNELPPPPPPASGSPTSPDGSARPDPNVERTVARPGVTGKGEGYGTGPIATPVRAYFLTRERIVFDIQIASAMNTYKAINGHFPKSHEEFMEKIIRANQIKLPELSRSEECYVYLPEKAAKVSTYDPTDPPLVVERPR